MSFNKMIVVGNLTRDPELRYTQQGTPVCTVNVASNDRSRDPKTKEYVDTPTFFRGTVWGQKAETVAQHFEKGSEIYLEGRFKPEEWTDREGRPRVTFGIQVSDFNFTGGSNRQANRSATTERPASTQAQSDGAEEDEIDFS
jgi:single-strand DNA-binding protein